jgi:hypothetical protein
MVRINVASNRYSPEEGAAAMPWLVELGEMQRRIEAVIVSLLVVLTAAVAFRPALH